MNGSPETIRLNPPNDVVLHITADSYEFLMGKLASMVEEIDQKQGALNNAKERARKYRLDLDDIYKFFATYGKDPADYMNKRSKV